MIAPSELIINADGSVFHLHVKPEQLADRVILVGDPLGYRWLPPSSIQRSVRYPAVSFIRLRVRIRENGLP